MMVSIIDKARIKKRLVITLIDLKNAFGEVRQNLIKEVLIHHHVPSCIQTLISCLYDNFQASIFTDNFTIPAIPIGGGVLQGACLSPLLFSMWCSTFIQFVGQGKYKQHGFSSHDAADRLFNPIHWFQFADDAAVVITDEHENQLLLDCFIKWRQWASMIIRVDKCVTFWNKKFSSRSLQFQPNSLSTLNSCHLSIVENHSNILDATLVLKWTTKIIKSTLNHLFLTLPISLTRYVSFPQNAFPLSMLHPFYALLAPYCC